MRAEEQEQVWRPGEGSRRVKRLGSRICTQMQTLSHPQGHQPYTPQASEAQRGTDVNICDGRTIKVTVQGLVILCHQQGMASFIYTRRRKVRMYL